MELEHNKLAPEETGSNPLPMVLILLVVIGIVQDPVLINLQVLWKSPGLFPLADIPFSLDIIVLLPMVAAGFLLFKAKQARTREWRISFLATMVVYLALKAVGVYWDKTCYIIAEAEGRHVGGGAAFGHIFLGIYILGPAQLLSAVVFYSLKYGRSK